MRLFASSLDYKVLFDQYKSPKTSSNLFPTFIGQWRTRQTMFMRITMTTRDILKNLVSSVLQQVVKPLSKAAALVSEENRNPWDLRLLPLWEMVHMVASLPVLHECMARTLLIRTRSGVESLAISGWLCKTSTISLTLFLCYLNSILEQSSLAVEIFKLMCNNRLNRRLRRTNKCGDFMLQKKVCPDR